MVPCVQLLKESLLVLRPLHGSDMLSGSLSHPAYNGGTGKVITVHIPVLKRGNWGRALIGS